MRTSNTRTPDSSLNRLLLLAASIATLLPGLLAQGVGSPAPFQLVTNDPSGTCHGTTILTDSSDPSRPRIVEVNMIGVVIWEYVLEESLHAYVQPGFMAEELDNGNILFVAPRNGVYEIRKDAPPGVYEWGYLTDHISHDADRLPNGHTIFAWGGGDLRTDNQVTEVDEHGNVIWTWSANNHLQELEVAINFSAIAAIPQGHSTGNQWFDYDRDGFTHCNAVSRLSSGLTMINLRNFSLTILVDEFGNIVGTVDWTSFGGDPMLGNDPHEPMVTDRNTILVALQRGADYQAVEVELIIGVPWGQTFFVWGYEYSDRLTCLRTVRDADRLPNGNTLLQGVFAGQAPFDDHSAIIEVTPEGNIVWRLEMTGVREDLSPGLIYRAQRKYVPAGDCNGNGVVTILDALLVARHAVGGFPLNVPDPVACNVVGAPGGPETPYTTIDVLDALAIARMAVSGN